MGQNIRLINDILEQTKLQSIPGILLQLDFCKAFDTIEWSFIHKVIALLNFGGSIQRWISTFYSNSESAVLNNGFCTNYFKLSRGVRQGCPLSPYLFIVAVEILACKIRQDREIKGISIFHKEFKLSQFADDTTLLCRDCNSVNRAITVMDTFGGVSGLKLNPSKTKALWLGSLRNCKDNPFNFNWPKEPIRILGTFVSYDEKQNEEKNFGQKMQKLDTILDIWNARNLTLFGRCLITKSLGISQLVHCISTLVIPKDCAQAVNSSIFKFIWRKRKDKIKRKVMSLDYKKGGLRAPSIETMTKSLKLAWISRFLDCEGTHAESWKVIPNHFLDKYGGINFLLRCNYDDKFLERNNLPHFYKLILQYFLELKISFNTQFCRYVLFNNKEILIGGQSFFYRNWFNKNVFLIQDLLREDGKLLSYPEFTRKYKIRCNFLIYMQVVSAIPKCIIELAQKSHIDKVNFLCSNLFQLAPNVSLDLLKMKNKDCYWLLIDNEKHEIKASSKWKRDLQIDETILETSFTRVKSICSDNKLKEFYFKLLHRTVVTKKELFIYGIEDNSLCSYWGQNDSIIHTLLKCHWTQLFFLEVIKWFNVENVTCFSLSPSELIFGIKTGSKKQNTFKINKKTELHNFVR